VGRALAQSAPDARRTQRRLVVDCESEDGGHDARFSKEAILRQARRTARAGGLFERVETLLGELLQHSDAGLTRSLRD